MGKNFYEQMRINRYTNGMKLEIKWNDTFGRNEKYT